MGLLKAWRRWALSWFLADDWEFPRMITCRQRLARAKVRGHGEIVASLRNIKSFGCR